jgi:hypothetical protein
MASLDVFQQDPFSTIQLTAAIEKVPFQPTGLGELNIFDPFPIRTKALFIEERQGKLTLLQTTPRGAPLANRTTEKRVARSFNVPRIAEEDTVMADEIQSIRAFGTESELMMVQAEVARRLNGPTGLLRNVEYTWENMRLGAIQGILNDADNTPIYNWFDEFQVAQPAEIAFDLSAASPVEGALRTKCNAVVRGMARASQGAFVTGTRVYGLCGDAFWDALVSHPDVTKTYYNWAAATELRAGQAFQAMRFGGIDFFNYRGSDDATTIAVNTDKVKFFPVGAPGIFQVAYAPGESFQWVNTPGKPQYVIPIPDRDRNAWWRMEVYSYPLFICTRPAVLYSGRRGA